MKRNLLLRMTIVAVITMCTCMVQAQTGMAVNTTGAAANSSAILDVSSSTQGFLVPRMVQASVNAISSPATGLMVYQTDGTPGFYYNSGTSGSPVWTAIGGAASGTAGGTLTGTYPNPTIATTAAAGNNVVAAIAAGSSTISVSKLTAGGTMPAEAGTALTALNASNLSVGTVPSGRLGTGVAASNTFLRGDGVWSRAINNSGSTAASSALFDLQSTTQGFLVPRMDSGHASVIGSGVPQTGMLVYQTDGVHPGFFFWNGASWQNILNDIYGGMGVSQATPGTIGQVLTSDGVGGAYFAVAGGGGTGTVTSVTAGTGLSGGTFTTSGTVSMPNVGTAATYGSASQVPVLTTDAQGRVSGVTNTSISGLAGSVISSGTIAATVGGTGNTSYTIGDILYASSTTALSKLNANTSGKVLTANGTGVAPSWQMPSSSNSYFFNPPTSIIGQGVAVTYGSLGFNSNNANSPYPLNNNNTNYNVVSQACTIDAFYFTGVCRIAGSGSAQSSTVTLYINGSATAVTATFTMASGAVAGSALSPASVSGTPSVAVNAGDVLYIQWTESQPASGPLPTLNWSIHAH
jgi:hypothetical protein